MTTPVRRPAEPAAEPIAELLTLRVADTWLAVDIMRVREVAPLQRLTQVPGGGVDGFLDLRGRLVPAIDLRRRLSLPPLEKGRGPRLVVVAVDEHLVGLIADRVAEVVRLPRSTLRPLPAGPARTAFSGAVEHQGRLLLLLNVKELLAESASGQVLMAMARSAGAPRPASRRRSRTKG